MPDKGKVEGLVKYSRANFLTPVPHAPSIEALNAIRLGAIGFDAVKQLVIARTENRPARLDLSAYPYLPSLNVKTTSPADYLALVSREAA